MLNKKQKEAVGTLFGQLMVVACPGSGKTTVIVERTNQMIRSGIDPEHILVITFTKEAAVQMKERYEKKYGKCGVTFCTIHSICFSVIKLAYCYNKDDILTGGEQWDFLSSLLREETDTSNLEDLVKRVLLDMTAYRNSGKPQNEYQPDVDRKLFFNVCDKYEEYKHSVGKIDFDDMLLLCREALKSKECLKLWQERFQFIMIDEFQDTNKIQAEIFYELAGPNGNLCIVGDDDQSIYGFRAADSTIMLQFEEKYPHCRRINLTTNYRSGYEIVEHAGKLIRNNKRRLEKDFIADKKEPGGFQVMACEGGNKQVTEVISQIQKIYQETGTHQETAVLYRTNMENQLLIGKLMKLKIPFYSTEATKDFHQDFIFRDIMAYWRLATGRELKGDLVRVLNHPSRYLKSDIFRSCKFDLNEMKKRCMETNDYLAASMRIEKMYCETMQMKNLPPYEFVQFMLRKMNYIKFIDSYCEYLRKDKDTTMGILNMIIEESKEFQTMADWMIYAYEYGVELERQRKERRREGVCLSTFHSAKGLEWDQVLIINANEGTCPHEKADTEEQKEEERRLFYVAVTRARRKVYIYYLTGEDNKNSRYAMSPYLAEMGLVKGIWEKKIVPVIK